MVDFPGLDQDIRNYKKCQSYFLKAVRDFLLIFPQIAFRRVQIFELTPLPPPIIFELIREIMPPGEHVIHTAHVPWVA